MRNRSLLRSLVVALSAVACGNGGRATLPTDAPASATAVGVRVVTPVSDSGAVLRATGEVRARHEAVLSAEASGRIQRFAVDVGSRVRKGEVLMELDASGARIQVEQARAAKAAAEAAHRSVSADLKRTEALVRGGAAADATLEKLQIAEEQAAANAQQAAAALAAAEDQLAKNTVRAPFDGVVTARMKSAGEYVATMPPTPVLSMVDLSTLEVRVSVPETVVELLAPGDDLAAAVNPSGKPFRARVRTIGAVVDASARTVDVRADLMGPLFRELRPGAIVEVRLGAPAAGPSQLFLPAEAVQHTDGKTWVWTVSSDTARRRAVEVQQLTPGTVRVLSGIGASDRVVADGGAGLADGARVHVQE